MIIWLRFLVLKVLYRIYDHLITVFGELRHLTTLDSYRTEFSYYCKCDKSTPMWGFCS